MASGLDIDSLLFIYGSLVAVINHLYEVRTISLHFCVESYALVNA
jgi:hypothetical protein